MRFKVTDIDNEYFYQIPKSLLTQKNYRGLSSDAKIIYSVLKDRMSLSRKNKWKDDNGDIYLLFKQEKIAEILGISRSTISRAIKQLEQYKLIDVTRQGLNRPNKIYIHKIDLVDSENDIQDMNNAFQNDESLADETTKPDKTRMCINGNPDVQERESGCADVGIKMCRHGNQDVQTWESRCADMDTSNNNLFYNLSYKKDNNNNNKMLVANSENISGDKYAVFQMLCNIGINGKLAIEMIDQYGMNAIQQQINILKNKKKVKNCIGWLIAALRDNYVQNVSLEQNKTGVVTSTVDNGNTFLLPLSVESAEYAKYAESHADVNEESPFYQSYLRCESLIKKA